MKSLLRKNELKHCIQFHKQALQLNFPSMDLHMLQRIPQTSEKTWKLNNWVQEAKGISFIFHSYLLECLVAQSGKINQNAKAPPYAALILDYLGQLFWTTAALVSLHIFICKPIQFIPAVWSLD